MDLWSLISGKPMSFKDLEWCYVIRVLFDLVYASHCDSDQSWYCGAV